VRGPKPGPERGLLAFASKRLYSRRMDSHSITAVVAPAALRSGSALAVLALSRGLLLLRPAR